MGSEPLIIDFEARSPLDLKKVGIYRWTEHPETKVLCYAAKHGEYEGVFYSPDDAPAWLLDALEDPSVPIHAHNSTVERLIIKRICGARHGWPVPKAKRYRCSAARARRMALPGALDKAGVAVGAAVQKDAEGKRVMLRLTKPLKHDPADGYVYDENPEKLIRLGQYCLTDILSEEAVERQTYPLPPEELYYYQMTERLNDRGVKVDVALVKRLIWRANECIDELNEKLRRITGGAVEALTNVAQLKQWVYDETGVTLTSLRKEDMEGLTGKYNFPPHVIRALKIRQEGAKSSVSKLVAILNRVSADGRVHGAFVYHGAGTGRYTSLGVQLQNLVRDTLKDFDNDIKRLDEFSLIEISKSIRGCFIPEKGHVFVDADYNAIEARGVGWLAGAKKLLNIYRRNGDPYCEMASAIYRFTVTKKNEWERFVGKQTILGCFASDTIVLTSNGWKPIITVSDDDLLWDGGQWVSHGGLIYQGVKTTEAAYSVRATPDHEILTERGWQAWSAVYMDPLRFQSARAMATLPSSAMNDASQPMAAQGGTLCAAANAGPKPSSIEIISNGAEQPVVQNAVEEKASKKCTGNTRRTCTTTLTEPDFSTGYHRQYPGATIRSQKPSSTMGHGEFSSARNGGSIEPRFSNIFKPFKDGMTRLLKWTGKKIIEATNPATSFSQLASRIWATGEASQDCKGKTTNYEPVYDIMNAGPNSRFTILTDQGPIIVHNCGYGMGGQKFEDQCEKFGKPVPKGMGKKAVDTYRSEYPEIPELWRDMEWAAIQAVKDPGKVYAIPNGLIKFRYFDGYLRMMLPSGRPLFYKSPKLLKKKTPWGTESDQLSYMAEHPLKKTWYRETTWGGKLVENAVQGLCRDLLFGAMKRLEAWGIDCVLSVHDQLVVEVLAIDAEWAKRMVQKAMELLPEWAKGFPVTAEPKITLRFGK